MKITGISIIPPHAAEGNPKVTPELLASSLARYSRSNKGLDTILSGIDWNDPDKSVDAIFKFVDYGHASITGMSGGIAIAIDGLSMFLAYKIFEIAQLCDGQESSTRYIKIDKSSLPNAADIGIPESCAAKWEEVMTRAFEIYREVYDELDNKVIQNPELLKLPPNIDEKIADRLRKNYALDRARYLIPFAAKTNAAYVMTARVWADTLRELDALLLPEATRCANLIRAELDKYVPRMTKHSFKTAASGSQAVQLLSCAISGIKTHGVNVSNVPDEVYIDVMNDRPKFLPDLQTVSDAFACKKNRYCTLGTTVRRTMIRAAWNNMAVAELRDLNRHRSGYRFSPLRPVGFYLPSEVSHGGIDALLRDYQSLISEIASSQDQGAAAYVYAFLLGTQVEFEHSTHLDKFIYEIELRTGMGAHFRYADHLAKASALLIEKMPELKSFIKTGNAEPEF